MNNYSKQLLHLFFGALAMLAMVCCQRQSEAWEMMDMAEEVMNSGPDSALSLLNSIQAESLGGRKEKARHALLKSMALDKNSVDTTVFDVLQPAIDYYPKKGSADERLRTYYYQGRIYQNRGENDSAMYSFLRGREFFAQAKDTMTIANLMVAQATIQYQMYRFDEYISNNIEAARLYGEFGRPDYEVSCLANAMGVSVINDDRPQADSLFSLLNDIAVKSPQYKDLLTSYRLDYVLRYGEKMDIMDIVSSYISTGMIDDYDRINLATAYHILGDGNTAKRYIDSVRTESEARTSLRYYAIKPDILEQTGDYAGALEAYKDFSATIDSIHMDMMSRDLMFVQRKHEMEKSNLTEIHKRDRRVWMMLCVAFMMMGAAIFSYSRYKLSQAKRQLVEKEKHSLQQANEKLELERKNTLLEKEASELERDRKALDAEYLRKENENLELQKKQSELEKLSLKQTNDKLVLERRNTILAKEAAESERDRRLLEAENLKLRIEQLEKESLRLKEVLEERKDMEKPLREILRTRMEMLNTLLAAEISNNDRHAKPYNLWRDKLIRDKDELMKSTRLSFRALYPRFIEYLEQHGLSESEINYLCLYAIGLRGTEVGEYIQIKRHYHISSDIRKKFGIDEHETNIGLYVRKLMKDL